MRRLPGTGHGEPVDTRAVVAVQRASGIACGDPSSDAYYEANACDNQEPLQFLNIVLKGKLNNTGAYLVCARCHYFLGSYAQALQDASEVIRREPKQAEPTCSAPRRAT